MLNTYWTLFALGLFGVVFSLGLFAVVLILTRKKTLGKRYFWVVTAFLLLAFSLSLSVLIPCAKDYKFVSDGQCLEDEAVVVSFTHIKDDPDGNGQTHYSQPKFYIEGRQEHVVLYAADVEIGKKYKIRYLPNTKICEVLECVE